MMISPFGKNRWMFALCCALACALIAPRLEAARPKAPTTMKKSGAKKSTTAVGKRTVRAPRGRRGRGPAILGRPAVLPIELPLPPDLIEHFAKGDIEHAVRGLLLEPASEKSFYLIREAQRIGEGRTGPRPRPDEAHRYYLNLGVAHHNLYLFVKHQGKTQESYARDALLAYAKARKLAPTPERLEVDLLKAALLASSDKAKAAERIYKKNIREFPRNDFRVITYLATYYAARGDRPATMAALRQAYPMNPMAMKAWLRVSDDFAPFKNEGDWQAMMQEWQIFTHEPPKAIAVKTPAKAKKQKRRR